MKIKKTSYELKDISVVPAQVSRFCHRGDVNPFVEICNREVYPIFVAPMASVTNEENYQEWIDNKLTPVIPRSVVDTLSFDERMELAKTTFVSVSLSESEQILNYDFNEVHYICIDIANGHMQCLIDRCQELKGKFHSNICLMTGNIANPETYLKYIEAGIDWVRCGIGGGSRCTTSANVSVHMGAATLIDEITNIKIKYANDLQWVYNYKNGMLGMSNNDEYYIKVYNSLPKIILDGGIANFDDIQKALCLGADAVMIGNAFARAWEACGEVYWAKSAEDLMNGGEYYDNSTFSNIVAYGPKENIKSLKDFKPFREYYGMSTKRAQKETGGNGDRTAEGISRPVPVEYNIEKWVDNMQSFLRSCMTYCDCGTIQELQNNAEVVILGGSGDYSYRK